MFSDSVIKQGHVSCFHVFGNIEFEFALWFNNNRYTSNCNHMFFGIKLVHILQCITKLWVLLTCLCSLKRSLHKTGKFGSNFFLHKTYLYICFYSIQSLSIYIVFISKITKYQKLYWRSARFTAHTSSSYPSEIIQKKCMHKNYV